MVFIEVAASKYTIAGVALDFRGEGFTRGIGRVGIQI